VVDFGAAFVIAFDWQHHPLTPHIERLQDVIEDLVQRQRRRRSASTTTQVRQDKFLELRFAQFRRNRLPAGVTRHSMRPEIWTLADFAMTLRNPAWARPADKFDHIEKPATSCLNTQTGGYNTGSLFARRATVGLTDRTRGTFNMGNMGGYELQEDSYDLDPRLMQTYGISTLVRGRNWSYAGNGLEYTSPGISGLTLKGQYDLGNNTSWNQGSS
jgi:hypothetical protein